jgi:transposase
MRNGILLPDASELKMEYLKAGAPGQILMVVRTARDQASCPLCRTASGRVHSRYLRKLDDLPWEGIAVRVQLQTRRFFCVKSECSQIIFTERLPSTVPRYGRRTCRLSRTFSVLAMALGGRPGARLAVELGIRTSGDSLLRHLRRKPVASSPNSPRILGIDDWAWRKGQRYGTILCDLERRTVVDLLPDRDSTSVQQWLQSHPGAEVISRDRASAYAEAARRAAPKAVQVADRWHLLRNLSEALQQILQSKHALLTQAARAVSAQTTKAEFHPPVANDTVAPYTRVQPMREVSRGRRLARYEAVMELIGKGISQAETSRSLGIDRRTIRRWCRAGSFPERTTRQRRHCLDRYASYLDQRWQQGCHKALLQKLHKRSSAY